MSEDQQSSQLTAEEVAALREIIKQQKDLLEIVESDKRAKWLWSSIRVWSIWIAGILTALSLGWETVVAVIRAAVNK